MARFFGGGSWFVNHGSGAALDNLPAAGILAVWCWVLRFGNGANQHLITKDNAVPVGWGFVVTNTPGEGALVFNAGRATTGSNANSAAGVVPLAVWKFVAASLNDADTPEVKLFHGGAGASDTVAEVTYDSQTNGSGTFTDDAAFSLYVGSLQRNSTLKFSGLIQRGGLLTPASTPDAAFFEAIRAATLPGVSSVPQTADMLAAQTHDFAFDYQDGDVTDLTGNGHDGTVTGATVSELLTPLDLPEGSSSGGLLVHPGLAGGMRG